MLLLLFLIFVLLLLLFIFVDVVSCVDYIVVCDVDVVVVALILCGVC